MTHFIQYHNCDAMGEPSQKGFGIVTNKRNLQKDDTVWLLMGKDRPRQYFLCETFAVDEVASVRTGRFRYSVTGAKGKLFAPPRRIDNKTAWFKELLRITGNFRYGLQPIRKHSIVEALQHVSR